MVSPLRTMLYPLLANEFAIPRPIPLRDPVMRATLFWLDKDGITFWQRAAVPNSEDDSSKISMM